MHFTALVTIAAILFYVFIGIQVAKAHQKYGVKLPATSGHPDFERMFRIQMNMLEWMPVFLPLLWLFAYYVGDKWAALIGLVWIGARVAYFIGYREAAEKRMLGFMVQTAACGVLLIGSVAAILWRMMQG
jgi:glutathione S-transferase